MSRERISACLIVQDEHRRLPGALSSLAFCDEIVVVDGGSGDDTVALARAAGAKVIENPWPGFAKQRNVALAAASGDWVLELDADERVSPELRHSIEALLRGAAEGADVAVCPLRNRFLGGLLGPSAKYPAYRTRLFRRGVYEHDESRQVHEGIEPRERPAVLAGDLEHELADTPREALVDAWRYAKLESAHIAAPRDPLAYAYGIAVRPATKLVYRLTLDGGWRDGWRGLVKIGLDAGSDALVWALVLVRARAPSALAGGAGPTAPESSGGGHFGHRSSGPPKIVAVAQRGRAESDARDWLAALAAGGADVALIADGVVESTPVGSHPPASDEEPGPPGQRVRRLTPLRTMRALDVEMQIRTTDAVVPFGSRATRVLRVVPGDLRPSIAGVEATAEPARALELLHQALGR